MRDGAQCPPPLKIYGVENFCVVVVVEKLDFPAFQKKKGKPMSTKCRAGSNAELSEGIEVEVQNLENGEWERGWITKGRRDDVGFEISFNNGGNEAGVARERIRLPMHSDSVHKAGNLEKFDEWEFVNNSTMEAEDTKRDIGTKKSSHSVNLAKPALAENGTENATANTIVETKISQKSTPSEVCGSKVAGDEGEMTTGGGQKMTSSSPRSAFSALEIKKPVKVVDPDDRSYGDIYCFMIAL